MNYIQTVQIMDCCEELPKDLSNNRRRKVYLLFDMRAQTVRTELSDDIHAAAPLINFKNFDNVGVVNKFQQFAFGHELLFYLRIYQAVTAQYFNGPIRTSSQTLSSENLTESAFSELLVEAVIF